MREALGDYLSDRSLRQAQGEAARRWIVSHYSTAAVLDAHEALFRRTVAGQPVRDRAGVAVGGHRNAFKCDCRHVALLRPYVSDLNPKPPPAHPDRG